MINPLSKKVSVVSITKNNAFGLAETLRSLSILIVKPFEVIVIDGGSDESSVIINDYIDILNIIYICESDGGIYEAMNKGRLVASGDSIHYLNAGDTVGGEPYRNLGNDKLLPVLIRNSNNQIVGIAKPQVFGMLYCHQGIFFDVNHPPYDIRYRISSDFQCMLEVFPYGFSDLNTHDHGFVFFNSGGVSSINNFSRDFEIFCILFNNERFFIALKFLILALLKFPLKLFLNLFR